MTFAIRIERVVSEGRGVETTIHWEEWDTLKLAEQRAATLRRQNAIVEIYRAL